MPLALGVGACGLGVGARVRRGPRRAPFRGIGLRGEVELVLRVFALGDVLVRIDDDVPTRAQPTFMR